MYLISYSVKYAVWQGFAQEKVSVHLQKGNPAFYLISFVCVIVLFSCVEVILLQTVYLVTYLHF